MWSAACGEACRFALSSIDCDGAVGFWPFIAMLRPISLMAANSSPSAALCR